MDYSEMLVLTVSIIFSAKFLLQWYRTLYSAWPPGRGKAARIVMGLLPVFSFAVILYTLMALASFDVVSDTLYIFFYIVLGYACIGGSMRIITALFDISWVDDVVNLDNKAAMFVVTGAFLGFAAVYAGSNVGDGPGWWCVVFAGGLGLLVWVGLALICNTFAGVFERITVGRDVNCGIRFGCYLLAAGIILARASAGDWTSFYMTVVEFADGWPLIFLTVIMIAVERYFNAKFDEEHTASGLAAGSVFFGAFYVILAAASVMLLPALNENPIYRSMAGML